MADEATLTFVTEEERASALSEIPTIPPKGTTDIDLWQREMDEKADAILAATIGSTEAPVPTAESQGEPVPQQQPTVPEAPPPVAPPQGLGQPAPPPAPEEDVFDFSALGNQGKVPKSQLPEELRNYKDASEVIKQFGHARRYANETEEKYRDLETKYRDADSRLQSLQERAGQTEQLQQEIDRLKSVQAQVPQTPVQQARTDAQIDGLQKTLADINTIDDDDMLTGEKFKATFSKVAKAIDDKFSAQQARPAAPQTVPTELQQEIQSMREELRATKESISNAKQERDDREQKEAALSSIIELQEKHPELKTSKPLINGNDNVQKSIMKFCDRVYGGYLSDQDWHIRNLIINGYITGDPEVVQMCESKGVQLGDVGITDTDIKAYARVLDVDRRMRGQRVNPNTGAVEQYVNKLGIPVSHASYEDAYKKILDEYGITDQERANELKQAEIRSQQSLTQQMDRRDTSPEILGNAGSTDSKDFGADMTEEDALELLGINKLGQEALTNRSIDQIKMENGLRQGNPVAWSAWEMLNRAKKRLGLDEEKPDSMWKRPPAQK